MNEMMQRLGESLFLVFFYLILYGFKLRVDLTFLTLTFELSFFLMQVFRSLKTNASRPSQGYLDEEVKKLQRDSELESCWSEVIQMFSCSLLKSRFFQVTLDGLKQSGISITIVR